MLNRVSITDRPLFEGGSVQPIQQKSPKPTVDVEVRFKNSSSIRAIYEYQRKRCCDLFFGIIALILGAIVSFVVPALLGIVVDAMLKNEKEKIKDYCLYMLIICVVSGIGSGARGAIFNIMGYKVGRDVKYDLFWYLIRKDVTFFDERRTGDVMSRISSDVETLQQGLTTSLSVLLRSAFFIIATVLIMASVNWKLTLIAVIGIVISSVGLKYFFSLMIKIAKEIQDKKALYTEVSEEIISNMRTVKAFANEANEAKRIKVFNDEIYEKGKQEALIKALQTTWGQVSIYIVNALIIYFGNKEFQKGQITIGQLAAFLLYMILLIFNFILLQFGIQNVAKLWGASEKVVEYMQHKPEVNVEGGIIMTGEIKGVIEFKNVKFSYPTKKEVQVMKDISLKIEQNQVVAIVGKSGSGKSSFINLVERFYDVNEGQILFDGTNIKELNPQWLKTQISIVSQEPVLFSTTIKKNIIYGMQEDEVTEELLFEACRKANCLNFIQDKSIFPDGFDTLVGERGVKLSGGQKQRVAIARALIKKPKLLLLDEATSALDAESEHLVQTAIDELIKLGQQTVIVVAHRLSTIKDADLICVLEKGDIIEKGTHDELLEKGGVYKSLVKRQLQGLQGNGNSASKERERSAAKLKEAHDDKEEKPSNP